MIIAMFSGVLGFIVFLYFDARIMSMAFMILSLNSISYLIELRFPVYERINKTSSKIKTPYRKIITPIEHANLGLHNSELISNNLSKETILSRIKVHNVRGLGEARFSTYQKIDSLIRSSVEDC